MTLTIFGVGAALLALWFDARRPAPSIGRAMVHAALAFVALQLLMPVLQTLEADRAGSMRLAAILLLLILPTFAYGFYALCRLFRVLAGLAALR